MAELARRTRKASQPREVTRELVAKWELKWPALKSLNDATLDKPRGFALARNEAFELAGSEAAFKKVAKYWKRTAVWIKGITIVWEAATKSYRFIEVDWHFTEYQEKMMVAAERKHREEALKLGLIRDNDLESDHQRRLRVLLMNQHSDTAGKIESQREFARLALVQPETMPRINGK